MSPAGRAHGALVLVDTSAWIEYLRGTGSAENVAVRERVRAGEVATTEPVVMELLAGPLSEHRARQLDALLRGCTLLRVGGRADYAMAAAIYRSCRRAGRTLASQMDCLIAVVAMRASVPVLHRDRDFELIAGHTPLAVTTP